MFFVMMINLCYNKIFCFVDSQVARRLSLIKHPQCSNLSGGQAIELLAKDGDRTRFPFRTPMGQTYDCCFSFAGLRTQITLTIKKKEAEEGMRTSLPRDHFIYPQLLYFQARHVSCTTVWKTALKRKVYHLLFIILQYWYRLTKFSLNR